MRQIQPMVWRPQALRPLLLRALHQRTVRRQLPHCARATSHVAPSLMSTWHALAGPMYDSPMAWRPQNLRPL